MDISKLNIGEHLIQVGRLCDELAQNVPVEKRYQHIRIRTIEEISDGVVYLNGCYKIFGKHDKSQHHAFSQSTGKNTFEDDLHYWELYRIKDIIFEDDDDGAIIVSNSDEQITINKEKFCQSLNEISEGLNDVEDRLNNVIDNLPDNKVHDFNLEESIARMNAYADKNPLRILSPEEREKHGNLESGLLAGKPLSLKEKTISMHERAYSKTDSSEITSMQAKINALTKLLSPKERESLKEIIDWCGKEKAKSHYYEKLAGGFIKET